MNKDDLGSHYGKPSERAVLKQLDHIDKHCRAFIELSPFLVIGTIVLFHIDDSIYEEGKINLDKLMPIGRLAGNSYSKQLNRFEIKRKIKKKKLNNLAPILNILAFCSELIYRSFLIFVTNSHTTKNHLTIIDI